MTKPEPSKLAIKIAFDAQNASWDGRTVDILKLARVIDAYLPKPDGDAVERVARAIRDNLIWHIESDVLANDLTSEELVALAQAALSAMPDPLAMARAMQEDQSFQQSVDGWMRQTFPAEVRSDKIERAMRFLEEATELCQSIGLTHEKAAVVLNYVFGRPVGEPSQEVGGSMVTLAALCAAIGENMDECGQREFDRINTPEMRAKIAAKQVSKRLFGMTSERAIDPTKLEAE